VLVEILFIQQESSDRQSRLEKEQRSFTDALATAEKKALDDRGIL
jgi:hypothetical protein